MSNTRFSLTKFLDDRSLILAEKEGVLCSYFFIHQKALEMDQRVHERYVVEFPARFAGDSEGTAIVYNLGMGGCKIVTDQALIIGGMLALHLKVPQAAPAITVRMAAVRWSFRYEYGLEFLGMEESERERLAQFVRQLTAAAA